MASASVMPRKTPCPPTVVRPRIRTGFGFEPPNAECKALAAAAAAAAAGSACPAAADGTTQSSALGSWNDSVNPDLLSLLLQSACLLADRGHCAAWPMRTKPQYAVAARFALLNRAWAAAVSEEARAGCTGDLMPLRIWSLCTVLTMHDTTYTLTYEHEAEILVRFVAHSV